MIQTLLLHQVKSVYERIDCQEIERSVLASFLQNHWLNVSFVDKYR